MKQESYKTLTQVFLIVNAVFWLPWGIINLIAPQALAGAIIPNLVVYDLSSAVARVEVRAMYGGLQIAIGCFGFLGALSAQHRASAVLFHVLAMTAVVACRFAGLVLDDASNYLSFAAQLQPGQYNQAALTSYELPVMIFGWVVLVLRSRSHAPRGRPAEALSAES